MPDARIAIGFLLAIWTAAHLGELLNESQRSPFRFPVAVILLASAMELLAPLFLPVSADSGYRLLWLIVKVAGLGWLASRVFPAIGRRPAELDRGPLWERSQQLAAQCGTAANVYVSEQPARNYREVTLRPAEIRALNCAEIDALLARQFCQRGVDWGHELGLLILASASAALALVLFRQLLTPEAGRALLLIFTTGTAAAAAWLVPDEPALDSVRRAVRITRNPEAMLTALHAQAQLRAETLSPGERAALARALRLTDDQCALLLIRPLPRPSEERYPWSSGSL